MDTRVKPAHDAVCDAALYQANRTTPLPAWPAMICENSPSKVAAAPFSQSTTIRL
jgi:hypothetical protein